MFLPYAVYCVEPLKSFNLSHFLMHVGCAKGKIRVTRSDEIEIGKDLDENEIAIGFVETTNQLIINIIRTDRNKIMLRNLFFREKH